MSFRVDPALIGTPHEFAKHGVQVSPPAGWEALPAEHIQAVADAVAAGVPPTTRPGARDEAALASAGEGPVVAARPLAIFARPADGFWLMVSEVEVDDPAEYGTRLRRHAPELMAAEYRYRGIDVHQYYLSPAPGTANYKLLLGPPPAGGGRRLQLDYIVPISRWQEQTRAVESSMGSLRPLAGEAAGAGGASAAASGP